MHDDDETPAAKKREESREVVWESPPHGNARGGVVAGICLGIALAVVQFFCSQGVVSNFPRNVRVEFGTPIDRTGSLTYLTVQAAFLAATIGMLIVGIVFMKRRPALGAMLVAAAVTLAFPATACTLGAWTNVHAAFTP